MGTAANAESEKPIADSDTGTAAVFSGLMTTAMRMARGNRVLLSDEKRLAEYSEA